MTTEGEPAHPPESLEERVLHAVRHAAHLLPDQAPIRVFIHHNTLHAFQHLPFHEAVRKARDVYGAEPYLAEDRFRAYLRAGRITADDLNAALEDDLPEGGSAIPGILIGLRELRRLLLCHGIAAETPASLRWKLRETTLLARLRADAPPGARGRLLSDTQRWLERGLSPGTSAAARVVAGWITGETDEARLEGALSQAHGVKLTASALRHRLDVDPEPFCVSALWAACSAAAAGYVRRPEPTPRAARLHRDVLLEQTGRDVNDLVLPLMIRLCSAFFDDGVAQHALPQRELGFYRAVRSLLAHGSPPIQAWLRRVRRAFRAQEQAGASPLAVAIEVLGELGVEAEEVTPYLERLLLSLPGWAGLMARLERNPEEGSTGSGPASLLEFLTVRLVIEREALRELVEEAGDGGALASLSRVCPKSPSRPHPDPVAAFQLFQLMQLAGVGAPRVRALSSDEAHAVLQALDDFDDLARRRIFCEAFERHYRCQILDAVAAHTARSGASGPWARARFQVITCFDEREESFRRQIEEVAPDCETLGAPGFFGAAMRFRGVDESSSVPLAPVAIRPTCEIEERPRQPDLALHQTRAQRRRLLARIQRELSRGSRSLWRGTLLNTALGLLATLPLLTRILSPRTAGWLHAWSTALLLPSPRTELSLHHETASEAEGGTLSPHQRGFKRDERVARVAAVLEHLGPTRALSRLVLVLGHGATTLNNPHKSAYDCGACGGRQGGPNARVFCQMANEPEVRRVLAERGIQIPDDTWFVGGQHDTCSDQVTMFDSESIPATHRALFAEVMAQLHEARARTAQERCRRLFSAPRDPSPALALRHVEARSEHLAEPRPEFGHATNAVAFIGRRAVTRGLFLDRRAFLLSYDPAIDPDGQILERTLAAATPVGAGINLEYYFSHVDNDRYGAGSKLPHTVAGLVGVMSGHASDLRTGLPRQMIEIHEAMRLLVVVEATPERLLDIAGRQPELSELMTRRWIQLVSLHPETRAIQVFTDRGFVPYSPRAVHLPTAKASRDYYRGARDFLPPAQITA